MALCRAVLTGCGEVSVPGSSFPLRASKWSYQQIARPQPGRGATGSAPETVSQSQDRQTFDAILSGRLPELGGVGTASRLCACLGGRATAGPARGREAGA